MLELCCCRYGVWFGQGLDKRGTDMAQINIVEEKTDLSKLINLLETKQEEVIYILRNGEAVAQITLISQDEMI